MQEFFLYLISGLAVPDLRGVGQGNSQAGDDVSDLVAHVDTVSEFAAKNTEMLIGLVNIDCVLARKFYPVGDTVFTL